MPRGKYNATEKLINMSAIPNGAVSIFAGRKSTANSLGKKLIDIYSRQVPIEEPKTFSEHGEVNSLTKLIELNLGLEAKYLNGILTP